MQKCCEKLSLNSIVKWYWLSNLHDQNFSSFIQCRLVVSPQRQFSCLCSHRHSSSIPRYRLPPRVDYSAIKSLKLNLSSRSCRSHSLAVIIIDILFMRIILTAFLFKTQHLSIAEENFLFSSSSAEHDRQCCCGGEGKKYKLEKQAAAEAEPRNGRRKIEDVERKSDVIIVAIFPSLILILSVAFGFSCFAIVMWIDFLLLFGETCWGFRLRNLAKYSISHEKLTYNDYVRRKLGDLSRTSKSVGISIDNLSLPFHSYVFWQSRKVLQLSHTLCSFSIALRALTHTLLLIIIY